jgi:hypothetical protein
MNWNDYFTYDADAGRLIWKDRPVECFPTPRGYSIWRSRFYGKAAGYSKEGRVPTVCVDRKTHRVHRIIWEMHNGPVPGGLEIDHRNGIRHDNRLENLRLATRSQNQMNRGCERGTKLGIKGVAYHKNIDRYTVQVSKNKTVLYRGCFRTKGEAAVAYAKASLRYHGAFSPILRKKSVAAQ